MLQLQARRAARFSLWRSKFGSRPEWASSHKRPRHMHRICYMLMLHPSQPDSFTYLNYQPSKGRNLSCISKLSILLFQPVLSILPSNWFASVPALFFYLSPWSSWHLGVTKQPRQETSGIWEIDGACPKCGKAYNYVQTRRPGAQSRAHAKSDYAPDMSAVTASFFPPATAPRVCDHVRKDWAIKHWTECCCFCMVQQLSRGASPVPMRITAPLCCQCDVHVTSYNLTHGIFRLLYTCHQLDNSWAESPLHRHDRGTPPANEGVICTQIRWKPPQSPRWKVICFAHTAWTPWRSDFPLGSDQARNKVRVWLRPCWQGQADPKFGCLIKKD